MYDRKTHADSPQQSWSCLLTFIFIVTLPKEALWHPILQMRKLSHGTEPDTTVDLPGWLLPLHCTSQTSEVVQQFQAHGAGPDDLSYGTLW